MRDSIIYALPNFLSKIIAVLLVPLYTRILSPGDYGALDLLLAFGALANLCVAFEISQGNAWHYINSKDAADKKNYASSALWFTLICYTGFVFAMLLGAPYVSTALLGREGLTDLFRLALGYIWLNGVFLFLQNQLRWELRSKSYALTSLVISIVTPIFAIFFAYGLDLKLFGIILGMIVGAVAGIAYCLLSVARSFEFTISKSHLWSMLKYSLPLVPSGIAVFVSFYIGRWMLQHYMTLDDVGLYVIAFRISSMVGLLVVGFRVALTPLILAHHQEPETPRNLALIFRIFAGLALLVTLGLSLFAEEILKVLTTPAYYEAAILIPYLIPAMIFSNGYIFAPGIDIVKKTYIVFYINLGVALLNVALNFVFIPQFGLIGAGVSALLGAAGMFVAYMVFSQKFYPVPHAWFRLALAAGGISALICFGTVIDASLTTEILYKIAIAGVGLALIISLKLIELSEISYSVSCCRQKLGFVKAASQNFDA